MGKHIHNLFLPSWLNQNKTEHNSTKGRERRRAAPTGNPPPHKPHAFSFQAIPSQYTAGKGRQQCSSEQAKHAQKLTKNHP
jgi:hypothetical protein